MRICPNAMPSIVIVSVSCATDAVTPSSACMTGSAGRYISVASGAIALITPRNIVKRIRIVLLIVSSSLLQGAAAPPPSPPRGDLRNR